MRGFSLKNLLQSVSELDNLSKGGKIDMNRRDFLHCALFGGAAIATGLAATKLALAHGQPLKRSLGTSKLIEVHDKDCVDWTINDGQKRIRYTFVKGPGYVNEEQAFPYMEEVVNRPAIPNDVVNLYAISCVSGKDLTKGFFRV